jgi:hypothetical protein
MFRLTCQFNFFIGFICLLISEVDPENWTDFGMELRCDIASRMVKNQGDINGELTKET